MREEELELLHEIDLQMLSSARPLNETFKFIVNRTKQLLRSDRVIIFLRRGGNLETAYSTGELEGPAELNLAASRFLPTDRTSNIGDLAAPPRSLLSTPIVADDTVAGVISVESAQADAFREVHERILVAIAAQIAIALQRAQSFDQNKLFAEVDGLIFATPEAQQVIPAALQKVIDALQVIEHVELSSAQIMFLRGEDGLEVVHSTNPADVGLLLAVDQSVCGRAIREHRTITIGDVTADPDYKGTRGSSIRSKIAIPLKLTNSDVVIGVLNVESEQPDAFEGFSQVILDSFAARVITLLAFAKLVSDLTESIEVRNANDLLVAVGDQAHSMIHRINNIVGAMRIRILELRDLSQTGEVDRHPFLIRSLAALKELADETLRMPEEVTRILDRRTVTVNPNEVIDTVLATLTVPSAISVRKRLDPSVPPLSLYSFDIVVENLLRNAIDAMPDGGVLTISTLVVFRREMEGGYLELAVRDTGVGMHPEIVSKIFDINFSTKHSSRRGYGLGLWWIRNFVLRVKGDISVTSTPGAGSEFVVKLPIDRDALQ